MIVNKTYNEDCLLLMSKMPNDFVDMVITSPPYNIGYNNMHGEDVKKYETYVDKNVNYEEWLFNVIDELLRVTKNHIFFNIQMLGNNKVTVLKLLGKYALQIKDIIIWNKKIAPPHIEAGIMNSKFEFIIILSNQFPEKKKFYDGNFKGNFNNVIDGINATNNKFSDVHNATFPDYLPKTILSKFGQIGELVYDPFMGTGTTAIACIDFKRNFIGSEIDSKYYEISEERVKPYFASAKIFNEYNFLEEKTEYTELDIC